MFFGACLCAAPARALPEDVIPPGREPVVIELVDEALRGSSVEIDDVSIQIDGGRIRVQAPERDGRPERTLVVAGPDARVAEGRSLAPGVALLCDGPCSASDISAWQPIAWAAVRAREHHGAQLWQPPVRSGGRSAQTPSALVWLVLLLFVLGTSLTLGSIVREVDAAERRTLAAVLLVALGLRLAVASHQLMSVHSYTRELPWLWRLQEAGVPVLALLPDGLHNLEKTAAVNLCVSVLLVFAVWAHARVLWRAARPASIAAGLAAAVPLLAAYSRSEVLVTSSLLFGSIALTALQRFTATQRLWLTPLYGATAIIGLLLAIEARPLSFLLALVFVPALYVYGEGTLLRARNLALLALGAAVAVVAVRRLSASGTVSGAPGVAGTPSPGPRSQRPPRRSQRPSSSPTTTCCLT